MTHTLKTWPKYFQAIALEEKKVEIRKNDRAFQVGDTLHLLEYEPETELYTGSGCIAEVSHIVDEQPFVPEGYVAMSIDFKKHFLHHLISTTGGTKDPSEITTAFLTATP